MTDDKLNNEHEQDAQLQRRFAALRAAEAATAPPVPDGSAAPRTSAFGWTSFAGTATLPRLAAGLAAIALGVGLFVAREPAEDPAALYTQIMAGQTLETDALLVVSEGTLPALYDIPGLLEIDFDYNPDALIN